MNGFNGQWKKNLKTHCYGYENRLTECFIFRYGLKCNIIVSILEVMYLVYRNCGKLKNEGRRDAVRNLLPNRINDMQNNAM